MSDNIEIIITGDFVPPSVPSKLNDPQLQAFLYEKELLEIVHKSDLAITNLEVPLTYAKTALKKSGPSLFGYPENIRYITLGGFNMVTLANNHIMDYDEKGLSDTIELCNKHDLIPIGAGESEFHAKQTGFIELKGKKIAVINTAENEFLKSRTSTYQAHGFDIIDVYKKIERARKLADFVLLIYHGGVENFQLPYPTMQKNLKFLIGAGLDAIVCHHTHCYSGYEYYNDVPIFYGLGNFYFNRKANSQTWFEGIILKLIISQDSKLDFEIIPYEQSVKNQGVRLMKGDELDKFDKSLSSLNEILSNDELYLKHWDEQIKKITPKLIRQIYPPSYFSSEIANMRRHKGSKKLMYLLNLIRTDSSHACLLNALEDLY